MNNAWRCGGVAVVLFVAAAIEAQGQTVKYIDGVFVTPRDGTPIALTAYAEVTQNGILQMVKASLEEATYVADVKSVLVSLPNWRPVAAFIATKAAFRDALVEKRQLPISAIQLNIYALRVRVPELERRNRIDALLTSIRASHDNPGYGVCRHQERRSGRAVVGGALDGARTVTYRDALRVRDGRPWRSRIDVNVPEEGVEPTLP